MEPVLASFDLEGITRPFDGLGFRASGFVRALGF